MASPRKNLSSSSEQEKEPLLQENEEGKEGKEEKKEEKEKTKEKAAEEKKDIELPKIIHFIWAGGVRLMPASGIEVVTEWAKKHPSFGIYLWVDKQTAIAQGATLLTEYKGKFKELDVYEEKSPFHYKSKAAPIILKDITMAQLRDKFVAYEIEKLTPNYGCSSDLLRYLILYEYGGAYFDSDVFPGKNSLEEVKDFNEKKENHLLYVDPFTQQAEVKDLEAFDLKGLGNDSFICTKNNPVMKLIHGDAQDNYDLETATLERKVEAAHCGKNIKNFTIELTGPMVVKKLISGKNPVWKESEKFYLLSDCLGSQVVIKKIRDNKIELTKPAKENTGHWLKARITAQSEESALISIEKTIKFELEQFGVVRLDDHIEDLLNSVQAHSSGQKKLGLKEASSKIEKIIENLLKEKKDYQSAEKEPIDYVQVTGKYPNAVAFCQSKRYRTLFDMKIDDIKSCREAVYSQSKYDVIMTTIDNIAARQNKKSSEIIRDLKSGEELKLVADNLKAGIEFFKGFVPQLWRFEDEGLKKEMQEHLINRIKYYQACIETLNSNKNLPRGERIKISEVDSLLEKAKTPPHPPPGCCVIL